MAFAAEAGAKLACGGWWKYLAVPFAPIAMIITPPFLFVWILIMVGIHYSSSSFLNTVNGSKSWTRSLESALTIWYCFGLLVSILVIGRGCKLVSNAPVIIPP